jgi:hypothetical protein
LEIDDEDSWDEERDFRYYNFFVRALSWRLHSGAELQEAEHGRADQLSNFAAGGACRHPSC